MKRSAVSMHYLHMKSKIGIAALWLMAGAVSAAAEPIQSFFVQVQTADVTALTKIPGIGKKTAERMLVELRDRVSDLGPAALSSAGVHLSPATVSAALGGVVAAGVFVGLVIGKPIGVVAASLLARRTGVGEAPAEVGTRALVGLGATAGIGFTVGLFIAELAFPAEPLLLAEAKIGLLTASVVAGALGYAVLRGSGRSTRSDLP